jgi:hypothetical protein
MLRVMDPLHATIEEFAAEGYTPSSAIALDAVPRRGSLAGQQGFGPDRAGVFGGQARERESVTPSQGSIGSDGCLVTTVSGGIFKSGFRRL